MEKVKSSNMKHPDHFCSRNDCECVDCVCTCYAEGFAKGSHDERLEIEKLKLIWSDIGYKNGVERAKEKIIEADKQIGDCYPFLTTENEADKEQIDKYNKMVYFFFHKVMENSIAALNELLTDKS